MSKLTTIGLHAEELEVWTLDFETYYNTREKYSLRSMTTTEYVRDPRFKAHCLSVIAPDGREFCVTHKDIPAFLRSIPWEKAAILAHNTAFDGFIISDVYGHHAAYYLDTLSMSLGEFGLNVRHSLQALAERLGLEGKIKGVLENTDGIRDLDPEQEEALAEYAIVDVEQCLKAFRIMRDTRGFPAGEMDVIHVTLRAFIEPKIMVDAGMCRAEIEDEARKLVELYNLVEVGIDGLSDNCRAKFQERGLDGLLGSNPCFAELIRQRGIEPPKKPSPTNPDKLTYAFGKTDYAFQSMAEDPRVSALCSARVGAKSTIRRTRAERFLVDSVDGTRPLPVPLKYCGARTHRWSGMGNINLQNLPSGKGGTSSRLRQALTAPPGFRFIVVDSSQIECRFNGWVWGQDDLVELFATGQDPYSQLASELYGVPVGKNGPNKQYRAAGKAMELGLGYGMADEKFYVSCVTGAAIGVKVDITRELASQAVDVYRMKRHRIVDGWRQLNIALNHMANAAPGETLELGVWQFTRNAVEMPNGLFMHYPNLRYQTIMVDAERHAVDAKGFLLYDDNGEPIIEKYKRPKSELVYDMMGQTVRLWGSKFDENLVQSSTRTIMAERAMVIARELPVVLLVHDEVVALARETEADDALKWALDELRVAPDWCEGIPLDAEGGHSTRYDVK